MTECKQNFFQFSTCKSRKVRADFSGGRVSSDGGILFLKELDQQLGLTKGISNFFPDERERGKVNHSILSMFQQRIYGLCLGYKDLNDHDTLRHDVAFQTATNRIESLASSPTLCRFEKKATREIAYKMNKMLVEQFIQSYSEAPKELILDFDATDDRVHGNQEGRFFHGYYDHYCFLPLYVFCGDELLVSYLRPSKIDGAKHSLAILSLLVKRLRQAWPKVKIIFRADSGFCRYRIMNWCERHDVGYILGLAKNNILKRDSENLMQKAKKLFEKRGKKSCLFKEMFYGAKTWGIKRKVIAKAEFNNLGENLRFLVTNLSGAGKKLYKKIYVMRGDCENRIKEQQLMLFADRTSAHRWWTNQFRLMLSSFAYVLMQAFRKKLLKDTVFFKAQVNTIRLKFLKIGAVLIRNTRKIKFKLSSVYPHQELFKKIFDRISTA